MASSKREGDVSGRSHLEEKVCWKCRRLTIPVEKEESTEVQSESCDAIDELTLMQTYNEEATRVNRYGGIMRRAEMADQLCPNEFMLYHMLPDNDQQDEPPIEIPLMIAYKTGFGDIHHYPIRSLQVNNISNIQGKYISNCYYYVETGPSRPPCFSSLSSLVRYYEVYNHLIGPTAIEVFPWWQMDEYHRKPTKHTPSPAIRVPIEKKDTSENY